MPFNSSSLPRTHGRLSGRGFAPNTDTAVRTPTSAMSCHVTSITGPIDSVNRSSSWVRSLFACAVLPRSRSQ
eukprot:4322339-Amphidinium_carterae.1